MELHIIDAKTKAKLCTLERISNTTKIGAVKDLFFKEFPKYHQSRQSFRLDPKSKSLKNDENLGKLNLGNESILYFKDLGPQIAWSTVFYCEYSGPLFVYLIFYFQLPIIYGDNYVSKHRSLQVVHLAAACHTFHYLKRIAETKFVHRFSHSAMPLRNLFKNCMYYWTFAGWMSFFINHPLYTPPTYGNLQIFLALACFIICEIGNLSVHIALKNLRPPGSNDRKIPCTTRNPFTLMFNFVSCPNYTYEVGSWIAFAIMTQSLVGLLFSVVGLFQMSIWALGKHRNYLKEFTNYPTYRKAIVPFVI